MKFGPGKLMPRTWSWLSFADPNAPEGSQFLGCILGLGTVKDVLWAANQSGINPGGQVAMWEFDESELLPEDAIWKLPVMVLLSEEDLTKHGVAFGRIGDD